MSPLYAAVLDGCAPGRGARILDVGCGSGLFCEVARERGLVPAGIDAAEPLLAIARERFPGIRFDQGEMESLRWPDASFDLVTGNNSFQYAADPVAALREARRVLNASGRLSIQVWGAAKHCEMATYMAALGSVLHLLVLRRRILLEEAVLSASPAYRASMGMKPRFLPDLAAIMPHAPRARKS